MVNSSSDQSSHGHGDDPSGTMSLSIRMSTGLNVLSLLVEATDLVQSVEKTIEFRIGIPVFEQELYYRGEKLRSGSTLREYSINDIEAELKLVDKRQVRDIIQNPDHANAWELLYDFVFLVDTINTEEENNEDLTDLVKDTLRDYLIQTPPQFEKAKNYIKIFTSSAALDELISFCRSDIEYHESCAKDLISILCQWSKELPPTLQCLSAPILLELFTSFSGSSHESHLNNACRSSLGDLMVYMKLSGDRETITDITMADLNIILDNIFTNIGRYLTNKVSYRRSSPFCPLRTDVTDLKKFLLPIKKLIMEDLANYRVEDITYLQNLLSQLIIDMEFCLNKMEELLKFGNSVPVGCYEHIVVLHELSSSSQLFQGIEAKLWTMLMHKKLLFCYLMINYGRRSDNHEWIFKHKELTTFECRRHLAMFLFPQLNEIIVAQLPPKAIERSDLWKQSLEYINESGTDTLQAGLSLKFEQEEATGPGVRREWFYLVCKDLFGSQRNLFRACPNDRRRVFLKSASNVNLDCFKFAGRVIALALMHKVQIGIVLDRTLFLQLAEKSVSLEDIRDADPTVYNSCMNILEMDPERVDQDILALTFSVNEIDEYSGSNKVVRLVHNGENIRVNSKNRREYVNLLIQHWFVKSVAKQIDQFTKGFNDVISSSESRRLFFQSLELEDLDGMLHGSGEAISIADWKAHTEYNGYNDTDDQIVWFWEIVEKMSAEQRKILLFFWTSTRYPPIEGFKALSPHLSIHKTDQSLYHLPSSHTCDHQLCFPPYPSLKLMEDRLNAISQEHVRCSFGIA